MTFLQVLAVLRARWRAGLSAFAVIVIAVVAITLLLPKQYSATATVLVDFKNPDPLSGLSNGGIVPLSYMVTQVDVIRSGRVVDRVARALELNTNPELRAQWQQETQGRGTYDAWLADRLRRNLQVRPTRDSGALDITYESPDPRFSAALANAFADAYIAVNLELRTEPARQFSAFFDDQAKSAREALETAQGRLSAFQRESGLIATEERFDVETARLQELSSQAVVLQAAAAESSSRQAAAGTSGDRIQEVLNNGLVASLTADRSRLQARLEEISSRLGDSNPQVIELRASIDELQRRITAETARVTGSVGVQNTVTQTRLAQTQAALAEQRAKVLRLKQLRDEAAVLERDVESARAAYQGVVQRLNQTALESRTDRTNVSILARASEPASPSFPRVPLNVAISLVLGTIVGLSVALAREWRDRRLRTDDDVQDVLQVPVLAVLPKATAKALAREASGPSILRPGLAR